MKKTVFFVASLLLSMGTYAQAPQKMSYQSVVRNSNQQLITDQTVTTRISILQGSPTGTAVYVEEHSQNTNINGLLSLEIGNGTPVSGDFSTINWANGPYFIQTETDPNGGTNFTISGTSQMASVPYALYAENSGTPGPAGADGLSAYEVWLNAGNVGSETDFIASLVGPAGQQGMDGYNGTDGLSAYEIWINAGNVGTEADFLNSLIGATGAQGPQGPTGATGPQGPQGIQGIQGPAGADGLSAYEIWLNAGNLGLESDFLASLVGPTGAQGPVGPQGPHGTNGVDGLSAYEIWINAGNAGTEADFLNSLVGAQGPTGATGAQGPAGVDGTNGTNGTDGLSAYEIWINAGNVGTEADFLNSLVGAQGPTGATGATGATGPQGPAGVDGTNGSNGTDGLSAYEIWINAGNAGTEADFLNSLVGAQGPTGATGATGATGPQGVAGADGATGPQGPQGPAGPIAGADQQINFNDNGNAGADAELVYDKATNHMAIGTSTVNPDAALEINSTTGALMLPRLTTAQRDALTGADGMIVFNTSDKKIQAFVSGGSYSEGNSVGVSFGYSDNTQGNTFQIANNATLGTISVSIANPSGNPTPGTTVYTMKVYDSQGGTLLATSSNTFSAAPGGYTGGAFDFGSASVALTANTSYYFEVTSDNGSNFYLYASYSDNYTLGSMYVNGAFNATADIRFTVTSSSPDEWVNLH